MALQHLMETLLACHPHYIRCIKVFLYFDYLKIEKYINSQMMINVLVI